MPYAPNILAQFPTLIKSRKPAEISTEGLDNFQQPNCVTYLVGYHFTTPKGLYYTILHHNLFDDLITVDYHNDALPLADLHPSLREQIGKHLAELVGI